MRDHWEADEESWMDTNHDTRVQRELIHFIFVFSDDDEWLMKDKVDWMIHRALNC